jgi:hypothetical protein
MFTTLPRTRLILGAGSAAGALNQEYTEDGDEALSINQENREGEPKFDAPTRELTAVPGTASGDRCSNCAAPLAHDQRYCIQCGERRGQSTFPQAQPSAEPRPSRARTAQARHQPRMSSGATLVAGVGVLLLAIGLGVLIGHSGKTPAASKGAAAPEVITVQGGAGSGAGSGATAAASTAPTSTPTVAASHVKGVTKKAQVKEKAAAASTKVQKQATQAAGKVLGSSNNLPPPTSHTGSRCTNGQAGCQGGKFTGNFFGGG